MTVLHSGSTQKYSKGWDKIFAGKRRATKATKKRSAGPASRKKKATAKASTKKKAKGKKKATGRSKSRRR